MNKVCLTLSINHYVLYNLLTIIEAFNAIEARIINRLLKLAGDRIPHTSLHAVLL